MTTWTLRDHPRPLRCRLCGRFSATGLWSVRNYWVCVPCAALLAEEYPAIAAAREHSPEHAAPPSP